MPRQTRTKRDPLGFLIVEWRAPYGCANLRERPEPTRFAGQLYHGPARGISGGFEAIGFIWQERPRSHDGLLRLTTSGSLPVLAAARWVELVAGWKGAR
jgi:hypothetical protein